jgi:PKD repeat protein
MQHKNPLFFNFKYAYLLIGFIAFVATLKATPIDSNTAKTVAANFYTGNYNVNNPSLSLAYTEKSSEGEAEYYIYNVYPYNGFVIISADDAAHPIIGYSSEGYYTSAHISPEFSFWMQHYKKQIASIRLHKIKATTDIQDEWTAYKNNLQPKSSHVLTSNVNPLVSSVWAQSPYYNASCPYSDDSNALAGCVATAMGQIMKYWAYPPHGIGSTSYTDNPYGVLSADFDTTQYDWAGMPLNITSKNAQVAIYTYDLGVSVNMSYSNTSSSSYMINSDDNISAQSAFVNYFGYNGSSMQGLYMSNYSGSDWQSILENELNNKRPLQYAGSGDQGGHSWVCDGYNATGQFHMNWGWAGYEDGYFTLTTLNPDDIPLYDGEEVLIGIQPSVAVADFSANPLIVRAGDTVIFKDNSFGVTPITAWQWSVPGAQIPTSSAQNPVVIYETPGTYYVSETVTNSQGSGTTTRNNYIIVLDNNTVNVFPTLNDGTFTVQLQNASLANSSIQFSLYDMLGQKVYSTPLTQYITQISIVVPHGIYLFRAFDASGKPISTGKLVMK